MGSLYRRVLLDTIKMYCYVYFVNLPQPATDDFGHSLLLPMNFAMFIKNPFADSFVHMNIAVTVQCLSF